MLISGYFGIRLTWKSFFNFMWIFAFYKICHLFIDTVIFGVNHTIYEWLLKPISGVVSGGGWFVDVYILLMLVSPLLNRLLVVVKDIHEYLQYNWQLLECNKWSKMYRNDLAIDIVSICYSNKFGSNTKIMCNSNC